MPNYPVIVGVGQLTNHLKSLDQAIEPVEMMERVSRLAADDAGRQQTARNQQYSCEVSHARTLLRKGRGFDLRTSPGGPLN